jgi:cytochrome bd-type quinol oxidase subunit 1
MGEDQAIEGHWENPPGEPTPLLLFGWPDMEQERTRYGLETCISPISAWTGATSSVIHSAMENILRIAGD